MEEAPTVPLTGMLPAFFGSAGLYLGTRPDVAWEMTVDEACGYVDQLGHFAASDRGSGLGALPSPPGLYVSGGQPMSQPSDLEVVLDRAKRYGMPVEVATSTYWVDSPETAETVLKRFSSKLHLLTITTSRRDLDAYGIASFEWLLGAIRRIDLSVQVLVSVGPGEPFPREILSLEVVNCDSSVVRINGVGRSDFADDEAPREWSDGYLLPAPPRYARCAELLGVAIVPGGDVYPCAASIGFRELCLGNLNMQTIEEILARAVVEPSLIRLRREGPYHLFDEFRKTLPLAGTPTGFQDACDFHRQLMASRALQAPPMTPAAIEG